jgi:tetratricopeptide (TPR) repeat protein
MLHRRYRGILFTGVLVYTLGACFIATIFAETNPSTNATLRTRDDKSAAFTFALQAVQQLQTQQRATLQAVENVRQQAETTTQQIDSLRRLLLTLCAGVGIAVLATVLCVRSLLRGLRAHGELPGVLNLRLSAVTPAYDHAMRAAALLARGQTLLEQKHPSDALTCFQQAIALDTSTPNAFIKTGAALERLGRLDEALASYEHALALDGSHADAYIGKGNVLNRLERYKEALACFEQAADYQQHIHALPQAAHASS